jgi:hypothetical protein
MKHADLIDLAWTQQPERSLQQLRVCPACGKDNLVSRQGFLEVHNLPRDGKGLFGSLVDGRRCCRGSGQQLPRAQRREPKKVWTDEERRQHLVEHDRADYARMRNSEVDAAAHSMRREWSGPKISLLVVDDPIPVQ